MKFEYTDLKFNAHKWLRNQIKNGVKPSKIAVEVEEWVVEADGVPVSSYPTDDCLYIVDNDNGIRFVSFDDCEEIKPDNKSGYDKIIDFIFAPLIAALFFVIFTSILVVVIGGN